MFLDRDRILAVTDKKTATVDVPEWGEGAQVLIGTMGALDFARMQDWIDTLGHVAAPASAAGPTEDDMVTCDDLPPPERSAELAEPTYTRAEDMEVIVRWCVACILDPHTERPCFTAADVEALGAKNPLALARIYRAILDLNVATAENRTEFQKNSDRTPGDSSGGVSP